MHVHDTCVHVCGIYCTQLASHFVPLDFSACISHVRDINKYIAPWIYLRLCPYCARPTVGLAPTKLHVLEICRTRQRSTKINVLTSSCPEETKEQHLGLGITHVCFAEVDDSVVSVICLEFLQAKLLDESSTKVLKRWI